MIGEIESQPSMVASSSTQNSRANAQTLQRIDFNNFDFNIKISEQMLKLYNELVSNYFDSNIEIFGQMLKLYNELISIILTSISKFSGKCSNFKRNRS